MPRYIFEEGCNHVIIPDPEQPDRALRFCDHRPIGTGATLPYVWDIGKGKKYCPECKRKMKAYFFWDKIWHWLYRINSIMSGWILNRRRQVEKRLGIPSTCSSEMIMYIAPEDRATPKDRKEKPDA